MRPVRLTRRATADLAANLSYVAARNASAAESMARKVDEALDTLRIFPDAGLEIAGRRKFAVPGTPLILVYRTSDAATEITRCFDGRENWPKHLRG